MTIKWRMAHGELSAGMAADPRLLAVLLIGTNNLGRKHTPAQTVRGVLACARRLLDVAPPPVEEPPEEPDVHPTCPCCGGRMIIIEVFERRYQPRAPPPSVVASGTPAP